MKNILWLISMLLVSSSSYPMDKEGHWTQEVKEGFIDTTKQELAKTRSFTKAQKEDSEVEVAKLKEQCKPTGLYGVYAFFRDMKIIEMLYGVRPEKEYAQEKLYPIFNKRLKDRFDYDLDGLKEVLSLVNRELEKNPTDQPKELVEQKNLIENEIRSFSNLKDDKGFYHDNFCKSSMKRSEFKIFKQCRAAAERE